MERETGDPDQAVEWRGSSRYVGLCKDLYYVTSTSLHHQWKPRSLEKADKMRIGNSSHSH